MKPILQALLVADHVYVDATTNKKIVTGIFHRMMFGPALVEQPEQPEQPGGGEPNESTTVVPRKIQVPLSGHQSGSPFCYISLTEVRGKQPFVLRYVRLNDEKAIFQTEFQLECNDPLRTIELVFPLLKLPSDKVGYFALELLWNHEPLGCHRISVEEHPQSES